MFVVACAGKVRNVMWSDDVLDKWIRAKNPSPEGSEEVRAVVLGRLQ